MRRQLIATVAGALALLVLQAASGAILGPVDIEVPPGILPWMLASNVLIAGVLAWIARRAAWTGWRLAAALFVIAYGIGHVNGLIDAYAFDLFDRAGQLRQLAVHLAVPALLFAPVLVLLSGRWSQPGAAAAELPERSAIAWLGRFAACCVVYVLLYFIAGTVIFPYVQEFYAQRTLPSSLTIIGLQLFVRAPIFAVIGFLIVRMVPASRSEHALMVATAMSLLGGAAPLLVPNPFFPDAVRWAHFLEVVPSNFAFGFITGLLFGGSRPASART
jgi:hypothetical protein